VTGRVRERVRTLRAGQIAALLQHRPQVEGAVLVPTLLSAPVASLGPSQVSACLVQDTEVQCRARVAEAVRFAIGEFGTGRIAALLEHHAEVEPLNGCTAAVDQCVHAPHHLPAFPNHPSANNFRRSGRLSQFRPRCARIVNSMGGICEREVSAAPPAARSKLAPSPSAGHAAIPQGPEE
jgi:hypothetical protein